ncbi:MAG: 16S rRNA (cytidine(1402)-2'-O)-methyltransferase [Candidatus Cloacimonas sp.]
MYIVPTPIGNLSDMTFRAVEVLKSVSLIGAEDTRDSAYLLKHYEIETPTVSYHKFNEKSRVNMILGKLRRGEDVAIITDAGTPGISDPASIIISEAINSGIEVSTLPGATAFLPALVSSGLSTERFTFIGFLPAKSSRQKELFSRIEESPETLIFYEAPHRIYTFLETLYKHLGNRKVAIAREISKKFESYYRGELLYFLEHRDIITTKGEFVIICDGFKGVEVSDEQVVELIKSYLEEGESKSSVLAKVCSELNLPKNRVYKLVLEVTS